MADQEMDRSQPATPYKLLKARERGQVAKSVDVASVVVFTVAVVYLCWRGWDAVHEQFRFDRDLLLLAGQVDLNRSVIADLVRQIGLHCLALLGPFFIALLLAAVAANILQSGPVFALQALKPDWDRISPASGLKRIFSLQLLFHGLRSCLKMLTLTLAVYYTLKDIFQKQFFGLAGLSPVGYVRTALADISALGVKMALVLACIAALDLVFSRHQFAKKMRMSRRESTDETKNREGDPRIRSRLRQLRREMFRRSMAVQKTRHADVLITNPTHVAIALRYVHGQMESPQLLAKGAGALAAVMRRIAVDNNIPIVQNPPLARKLFCEMALDQHVPPALYGEVARIVVWVFAMRRTRTATSHDAGNPNAASGGAL